MFLMIAGVQSTQQSGIKGVPPFFQTRSRNVSWIARIA